MPTKGSQFLPSVSLMLNEISPDYRQKFTTSELPSLTRSNTSFNNDDQGVIRLPPLFGNISRPKSVDSALRFTSGVTDNSKSQLSYSNALLLEDDVEKKTLIHRSHSLVNTQSSPRQISHFKTPSKMPFPSEKLFNTPMTPGATNNNESLLLVSKNAQKHEIKQKITPISNSKQEKITNTSTYNKEQYMATPIDAVKAIITPTANDKKRAFAFITHSQETFPTKEPKIDNAPLARRKRRKTSTQELNILQDEFAICITPSKQKRIELAERCKMSEKAVQIWFQNKRQAVKRQKLAAEKSLNASKDSANSSSELITHDSPLKKRDDASDLDTSIPSLQIPSNASQSTPKKSSHYESDAKQRTIADDKTRSTVSSSPIKGSTPILNKGQALTFHLNSGTNDGIRKNVSTLPVENISIELNNQKENENDNCKSIKSQTLSKSITNVNINVRIPLKEIKMNVST